MKQITQTQVMVGLSGGVDSAVAALLLKQQGYQVSGVFMQNWIEEGQVAFCPADIDLQDAKTVCQILNIPFHTVSFAADYWDKVFQYFLNEYAIGRTPNPDIICNKEIKFKAFLSYALKNGADFIATGHYAGISLNNGQYQLLKAIDHNKDQSYFLHTLQSTQLAKSLFPLSSLIKSKVRQLACAAGFTNYAKKDSTGICFIGNRRFRNFLGEYLLARPGNIETVEGKIIGQHQGLMFYTLGQRQGLGIGGKKDSQAAPWYVIDKVISRQALIVGQSRNHPQLLSQGLICESLHWVNGISPKIPFLGNAKTRYRQTEVACTLEKVHENKYQVLFKEPQWAITPGQSVVFYQDNICLGGGIIKEKIKLATMNS